MGARPDPTALVPRCARWAVSSRRSQSNQLRVVAPARAAGRAGSQHPSAGLSHRKPRAQNQPVGGSGRGVSVAQGISPPAAPSAPPLYPVPGEGAWSTARRWARCDAGRGGRECSGLAVGVGAGCETLGLAVRQDKPSHCWPDGASRGPRFRPQLLACRRGARRRGSDGASLGSGSPDTSWAWPCPGPQAVTPGAHLREKRVIWQPGRGGGACRGRGAVPVLWSKERLELRALLPQAWAVPTQEGGGKAASTHWSPAAVRRPRGLCPGSSSARSARWRELREQRAGRWARVEAFAKAPRPPGPKLVGRSLRPSLGDPRHGLGWAQELSSTQGCLGSAGTPSTALVCLGVLLGGLGELLRQAYGSPDRLGRPAVGVCWGAGRPVVGGCWGAGRGRESRGCPCPAGLAGEPVCAGDGSDAAAPSLAWVSGAGRARPGGVSAAPRQVLSLSARPQTTWST